MFPVKAISEQVEEIGGEALLCIDWVFGSIGYLPAACPTNISNAKLSCTQPGTGGGESCFYRIYSRHLVAMEIYI